MHKKVLLLLIGIFLLSNVTALDYGTVIDQRTYDRYTFDSNFLNASYVKGNTGTIRMSCQRITGFCIAQLGWDTFVDELINGSEFDAENNVSYITFYPTGKYVFARQTKNVQISYLTYSRIKIREGLIRAGLWAKQEFVINGRTSLTRVLNHLDIRQTRQDITINI